MTVELEPIEGAVFAECSDCGNRLLIEPDASAVLVHLADGAHGVEPTPVGPATLPHTEDTTP